MNSIIPPRRSVLPNSAPHILNPISAGDGKTLQVVWLEEIDAHGLFYFHDEEEALLTTLLATHHNGYSCHNLAERIVKGDMERIINQVNFIRECHGTAIGDRFFEQFKK